jgi:hypothetical protein
VRISREPAALELINVDLWIEGTLWREFRRMESETGRLPGFIANSGSRHASGAPVRPGFPRCDYRVFICTGHPGRQARVLLVVSIDAHEVSGPGVKTARTIVNANRPEDFRSRIDSTSGMSIAFDLCDVMS